MSLSTAEDHAPSVSRDGPAPTPGAWAARRLLEREGQAKALAKARDQVVRRLRWAGSQGREVEELLASLVRDGTWTRGTPLSTLLSTLAALAEDGLAHVADGRWRSGPLPTTPQEEPMLSSDHHELPEVPVPPLRVPPSAYGDWVKERRIALGWTQLQLSTACVRVLGVPLQQSTISKVELGQREPSADLRAALDRVLAPTTSPSPSSSSGGPTTPQAPEAVAPTSGDGQVEQLQRELEALRLQHADAERIIVEGRIGWDALHRLCDEHDIPGEEAVSRVRALVRSLAAQAVIDPIEARHAGRPLRPGYVLIEREPASTSETGVVYDVWGPALGVHLEPRPGRALAIAAQALAPADTESREEWAVAALGDALRHLGHPDRPRALEAIQQILDEAAFGAADSGDLVERVRRLLHRWRSATDLALEAGRKHSEAVLERDEARQALVTLTDRVADLEETRDRLRSVIGLVAQLLGATDPDLDDHLLQAARRIHGICQGEEGDDAAQVLERLRDQRDAVELVLATSPHGEGLSVPGHVQLLVDRASGHDPAAPPRRAGRAVGLAGGAGPADRRRRRHGLGAGYPLAVRLAYLLGRGEYR